MLVGNPNITEVSKATQWLPGESGNLKGRKPKIYTVLKQSGYSRDDVRTAFHEISWMNEAELKKKFDNPKSPAIIKVIAHCFNRAIKKGDYRYIAEIIQQTIGAPKQTMNANITIEQPLFPDIKPIENVSTIAITEQPLLPIDDVLPIDLKVFQGGTGK